MIGSCVRCRTRLDKHVNAMHAGKLAHSSVALKQVATRRSVPFSMHVAGISKVGLLVLV